MLAEDDSATTAIVPLWALSACDPPCPGPSTFPPGRAVPIDFLRTHAGETAGSLMYLTQDSTEKVHLALRLRNGNGVPVELPVVRERAFTSGAQHIIGVPERSDARLMLRVFAIDPGAVGLVRIDIDEMPTDAHILTLEAPLHVEQRYFQAGAQQIPIRPPVAEISLDGVIPSNAGDLHIIVTPTSAALRLWGFVTSTNNVTQNVTVYTPR